MTYGHAERNLALIRQLEAETSQLLAQLDTEQQAWLHDTNPETTRRQARPSLPSPGLRSPQQHSAAGQRGQQTSSWCSAIG